MNVYDDELKHYGVLGMKWGVRKKPEKSSRIRKVGASIEKTAYSVGAKINPREFKYRIRKATNNTNENTKNLAALTELYVKQKGVLPNNKKSMKAIESIGIEAHKKAVYDNLNDTDIKRLKRYTDSARYSRSVNSYLAIGEPKTHAKQAEALKETLRKNTVDNITVYRSCNFKFSVNGVAKKLDTMSEKELSETISKMSKNFAGKSIKENRVFSTSTSPLFAIDTWRAVNPTAASTYNTYMIINAKNTPGVLADGRTNKGDVLVNTRSNQEAILAPNKLVYRKLEYDKERGMFAITVDAV
jgi:thiaminase